MHRALPAELGVEPSPALSAAAETPEPPVEARVSGRAAVLAQIEAGEAALAAGVVEAGLQRMRSAVAAARRIDDREPLAKRSCRWAARSSTPPAAPTRKARRRCTKATALAEALGRRDIAATGWREISWVQFLRAHYEPAERSLTRTAELADGRDEELAWVDVTRGAAGTTRATMWRRASSCAWASSGRGGSRPASRWPRP